MAGDRTSAAQELYLRDSDWRSEGFALVEFSNILATYVRTQALTPAQGTRPLAEAEKLIPSLTTVPQAPVLETAIEFAISAYDSRFITLARQMRVKLVTEDAKLRLAVP
ncbi:MAG: type II toxin-antitoxin system VapC family toxin, partial [Steroidobacteraceae bacterium]